MRISPLRYAAEFEQAAVATAAIETADPFPGRPVPWTQSALQAAVDQYGAAGYDLPFEYENDLFEVQRGRSAHFFLFH